MKVPFYDATCEYKLYKAEFDKAIADVVESGAFILGKQSASCIARFDGVPVFCDVDEDTFCMDMKDAENRITDKTRGILPVHLFLQTADMTKCMELAEKHRLTVLEDAAEAFGMATSGVDRG